MTNQTERRNAATEKQAAAEVEVKEREAGAATVADEIGATQRELARLAALDHFDQADLLAQENAKRRLARLRGALEAAQAKVARARKELDAATLEADRVTLEDLMAEVRRDEEALTSQVEQFLDAVGEHIRKHRELARSTELMLQSVRRGSGSNHDAFIGLRVNTAWSSVDPADPWDGIARALLGLRSGPRKVVWSEEKIREAQANAERNPYGALAVGPR